MKESVHTETITLQNTSKLVRLARSLKKTCLNIPSSAWVGFAGFMIATSVLLTQVQVAQAAPDRVQVSSNISALNVRNGPGTQYGLNGRPLYPGEVVRVAGFSNGWYRLPDGGWFSSSYTREYGGSTGGTGGGGTGGTAINRTVRATTTVNVRSGPGTQFGFDGRPLYAGETVRVIRLNNGWYQLPDGGWFSSSYATTVSGGGGTGGGGTGGTAIDRTVRATTTVNVRSGPGTQFGFDGRPLYAGETVRVIRLSSNGWYQLPDGGWFSSSYATSVSGGGGIGGGGTGGTAIDRTVRATTTVNVRSGPGTQFGFDGRPLYAGETVRVIRLSSNGWYQLPDGGWFSSSYATSVSGGGGIGGGGGSSATVSTNGSPLLIRSAPGGSVIGSLSNGSVVRLTGNVSGGYSQLSSGGWVSSSWLQ